MRKLPPLEESDWPSKFTIGSKVMAKIPGRGSEVPGRVINPTPTRDGKVLVRLPTVGLTLPLEPFKEVNLV